MAVNRMFGANALIGGTEGSLDSIDYEVATHGDVAIARGTGDTINFYRYDGTNSDVESVPNVIRPDNLLVASPGRWILITPSTFAESIIIDPAKQLITNDIRGNNTDLTLGYSTSGVDITIGGTSIDVLKTINTNSRVVSTVPTGNSPFVVDSTTMVTNLNAEFLSGKSASLYVQSDASVDFLAIPSVDFSVAPITAVTDDRHLTTKGYVDDLFTSVASHSSLSDLTADDHTHYILVDGTRSFTGVVKGVTPVDVADFATKGYVDTLAHDTFEDRNLEDNHLQYTLVSGTRDFTGVPLLSTTTFPTHNINPTVDVTSPWNFTTKAYVDYAIGTGVAGISVDTSEFVQQDGSTTISRNQQYTPEYPHNYFDLDDRDAVSVDELVKKSYVDDYLGKVLVSGTDEIFKYTKDVFRQNAPAGNVLNNGAEVLPDGGRSCIKITNDPQQLGSIDRVAISDGGFGFFVYDSSDGLYPQTFASVYDNTGAVVSVTETFIDVPSDTGNDAFLPPKTIIGDVVWLNVTNAGVGLVDGVYPLEIDGGITTSIWDITVSGGSITGAVQTSSGGGYINTRMSPIVSIPTLVGTYEIVPYVGGSIVEFDVISTGDGYTSTSYNLTEANRLNFTLSGEGTADLGLTDITYINPTNEVIGYSVRMVDSTTFIEYALEVNNGELFLKQTSV